MNARVRVLKVDGVAGVQEQETGMARTDRLEDRVFHHELFASAHFDPRVAAHGVKSPSGSHIVGD